MTYEQRIALVSHWFKTEIAVRFAMPNGIDPKMAAGDVIEGVNSQLPSSLTPERIGNLLSSVTKEVARSARTRTLPPTKDFVEATRATLQAHIAASAIPTTPSSDNAPEERAARLIRAGKPVGEYWFRGAMRQQLRNQGITEEEMRPYDLYIAAHTQ
jgi:hypothetical protein